ncbi:uncharacterized protein BP01DRAFT_204193 [Aspergillus saccharolyticus JOP 1030-1]|uniref:Uncharacterized protein n=1 Tax=Aspergillus saccharolyticus JOP 1030-1 TaxID=1450539 RepID=A0A318ZZ81_9EURO|nr:hypothetical protein BP01DRAFT_204193 [Aspergillus saccharolyticus JOP 1030-1]PYH40662.1 hypothetical protein BP01DRAFT_204193 [Aspergillus saccharolyticus JOP 1030-1]
MFLQDVESARLDGCVVCFIVYIAGAFPSHVPSPTPCCDGFLFISNLSWSPYFPFRLIMVGLCHTLPSLARSPVMRPEVYPLKATRRYLLLIHKTAYNLYSLYYVDLCLPMVFADMCSQSFSFMSFILRHACLLRRPRSCYSIMGL